MNAEFTLTFWRESFGMLALQIVGVVAIAAIAHYLVQSASWRRSIWQIAIATAGLLTIAEWSGAGRNTMNWAEMKLAARRTMAAVHPMTPESTPTFQSELTPVVPISTSLTSDRADSVSEPLSPPPVASSFKKSEATTATPAVWWPAWLWFAGFAVLSLRFLLLNSVFFLFRFFRRLPVHAALAARVQGLVPRLGLKRGVRVVALRGLTGPVAFGVVRPTIGVPPDYSHDFTPAEQDAMLAHELAHLSANDPAWSWLADMVSAVLWWHPLIWIARRQLRSASETAADEASALLQDGPETLAECLVNLGAKLASGPVYGGMGVAERGFRSALGQRVERLLKLRPGSWQPPRRWISLATKCFALTGLLIIAIGCGAWMSPRSSQPGPVMDAFWHSLDVSAMSGLFVAQVDSSAFPARKPARAAVSSQPPVPAPFSWVLGDSTVTALNHLLSTNFVSASTGRQKIKAKLEQIRIKEVFYNNLPLSEVIKLLRDESRKEDPDKVGINFFINPSAAALDPKSSSTNLNTVTIKVNPSLVDLRLADVLDLIVKVADHPIKYTIEDYAIIFSSRTPEPQPLFTRTFKVDPTNFLKGLEKETILKPTNATPGGAAFTVPRITLTGPSSTNFTLTTNNPATHERIRQYLTKVGVDLKSPKTVFFNDRIGVLMVRATLEDLEIIGQAIETLPEDSSIQPNDVYFPRRFLPDPPKSGTTKTNASNIDPAPGDLPYFGRLITNTIVTRTFRVDPNTFVRSLERISGLEPGTVTATRGGDAKSTTVNGPTATTGTNSALQLHELVLQFFTNAGIDLAAPKSVFFNDRNGLLMVRATLKDLEIIQQAIEVLNSAPAQVTIEARFAELKESDRGALGFNWFAGIQNLALQTNNLVPSKTNELAGAITGILTESQFRTVMKALEQRGGVDILSVPRVTTLSGRPAQISALDSKSIVTGVNSKTSSDGTVTRSPVVTPTPFGPMLDIIPTVSADGYSIQITVTATVTEFLGYEKPAPALQDSWDKVSKDAIPLPITRTRQVTTSAVVADGQTLVLGGLMSASVVKVKDKVPVLGDVPLLGRLFRSESKTAQKKNLLIFVTPTLIDPAGNRVHTGESLRSQQTILPQP